MKRIIALLTTAFVVVQLAAAESNWLTDLPKAMAKAKTEKKLVLMDFTGSDWCPPCKNLHKNVLTAPEFEKFAQKNLVLVELDFPQRKPQSLELKRTNRELSQKYEIEGYPTLILLDAEGKELWRAVGYDGSPAKTLLGKLEKFIKK